MNYKNRIDNKRYEESINKFIFKMIIIISSIVIFIPILLEYLIFRNNFVIVLSNEEWSGFFGSFIGGIAGAVIAGIVNIYGIKLTISYNTDVVMQERRLQESREKDKELKLNRPFMYLEHKCYGGGIQKVHFLGNINNNMRKHKFELINIGMNTAVDMNFRTNYCNSDKTINKINIFNNKQIILKHDSFEFEIAIPDDKKNYDMTINFQDLLENAYEQKIIFKQKNDGIIIGNCAPTLKNI